MRSVSLQAGLSANFLHEILTKGRDPSVGNLVAVASELDTTVAYLIDGVPQ